MLKRKIKLNIDSLLYNIKAYFIPLLFSSLLLTLFLSDVITERVNEHVRYQPYAFMTVNNDNEDKGQSEIKILGKHKIISNNGFQVKTENDSKYEIYYSDSENSLIILDLPVLHTTCVEFALQEKMYDITITDGEGNLVRTISSLDERYIDKDKISYYMFDGDLCRYIYIWYIIWYFLVWLLFFCINILVMHIIYLANKYLIKDITNHGWVFVGIFVFQVLYISIIYYFNKDIFMVSEQADAYYYMNPPFFDENKMFSIQYYAQHTFSFRGYFPHFISLICNFIDSITTIPAFYFYTLFISALTAYSFTFAIPKLINIFENKSSNCFGEVFGAYFLFLIFWHPFLFYQLTDIPAAFFAVSAISHLVNAVWGVHRNRNKLLYLYSGICWGISLSFRVSYLFVLIGLFLTIFICILKYKINKDNLLHSLKNWGVKILLFGAGIVIISAPQYLINKERDHMGMLPYSRGWYYDLDNERLVSDTWYSFNIGLHSYQFGATDNLDRQLLSIDEQYPEHKYYDIDDMVYIILTDPINFFSGYLKKLFWAMSASIESCYRWLSFECGYYILDVAILLNYFLIANIIYSVFNRRKKLWSKYYSLFLVLIFIFNVCIQTLTHMERRYFLFVYLLVYITNAYYIIPQYKSLLFYEENNKKYCNFSYWFFIICFLIGGYILRNTFSINFF